MAKYQAIVSDMESFKSDDWKELGVGKTISKDYEKENSDSFVKKMNISPAFDFEKNEVYYSVKVGYNKTPQYGGEANKYYSELKKLDSTRFIDIKSATKAADEFAAKFNNK